MIERRAIRWQLAIVVGVLVMLDQSLGLGALGALPRSTVPLVPRLLAGLLTVATLCLVLLLARWTWLRTEFAQRHGSVSVLSVVLAAQVGLVGGRQSLGLLGVTGPRSTHGLDDLLFLSAITFLSLLVISTLHRHRTSLDELETSEAQLRAALAASTTGLIEERERLAAHVRHLLERRLGSTSVRPALFTPERLRTLADDVLRPLSHQLASGASVLEPRRDAATARVRFTEALRALETAPVIRPRALAATMLLLTFRYSITPTPPEMRDASLLAGAGESGLGDVVIVVQWASLIESVALHAATFLIVLAGASVLAQWLSARDIDRHRPALLVRSWALTAITLVALGLASLALLRTVFSITGFGGLPPLTSGVVVGFTAPLLVITLITSLLPAAERALATSRTELSALNAELSAAIARGNALLEHERRLFARHLHASVQSAVNAASLTIERAAQAGDVSTDVLADAARTIDVAVEKLLAPANTDRDDTDGNADLDARVAAITSTWADLASVSIRFDEAARDHLTSDPVSRATLCDLVAEACANAVIHGQATRIEAYIRPDGPGAAATRGPDDPPDVQGQLGALDALHLRVADDGTFPSDRQRKGLGSRMLTASCTDWNLEHRDDGAILTATLPVR